MVQDGSTHHLDSLVNLFSFTASDLYKDLPTESIKMLKHFELCKSIDFFKLLLKDDWDKITL